MLVCVKYSIHGCFCYYPKVFEDVIPLPFWAAENVQSVFIFINSYTIFSE